MDYGIEVPSSIEKADVFSYKGDPVIRSVEPDPENGKGVPFEEDYADDPSPSARPIPPDYTPPTTRATVPEVPPASQQKATPAPADPIK